MRPPFMLTWWLSSLLVSLAVSGCVPTVTVPPGAEVTCVTDADCLSGFFCSEADLCVEMNQTCLTSTEEFSTCVTSENAPGHCVGRQCILSVCGDNLVDVRRREGCDDGSKNFDGQQSTCHADCQRPVCGDGRLGGNEMCETAIEFAAGTCLASCIPKCDWRFGDCDGDAINGCECSAEIISDADLVFGKQVILALGGYLVLFTDDGVVRLSQTSGERSLIYPLTGANVRRRAVCGREHVCFTYLDSTISERLARVRLDGEESFNLLSSRPVQGLAGAGEDVLAMDGRQLLKISPNGETTVLESGLVSIGIENEIAVFDESIFWASRLEGTIRRRSLAPGAGGFTAVVTDLAGPQNIARVDDVFFVYAEDGTLRRFDTNFNLLETVTLPIRNSNARGAAMVSGSGILVLTGTAIDDGSFLGIAIDPAENLGRFRVIASRESQGFGFAIDNNAVWLTSYNEQQRIPLFGPPPNPNDAGPANDGGVVDGGRLDGGLDGGPNDSGPPSDGGDDGGLDDGGLNDGGGPNDAGISNPTASVAISAIRNGIVPTQVDGAFVVDTRDEVPGAVDVPGFIIQGERLGPAVFVAIAPETLGVAVGDEVSLVATQTTLNQGRVEVTAVESVAVLSQANAIASLVQDVSEVTDLITQLNDYESELVRATLTIAGPREGAGVAFVAQRVTTTGIPTEQAELKIRYPEALDVSLPVGCTFELRPRALWRFASTAQFTLFDPADLLALNCPSITNVFATSATSVVLSTNRTLDAATIPANGSTFSFNGGLSSTSATVSGASVVITTSPQTPASSYALTVSPTMRYLDGGEVTLTNNSFLGFQNLAESMFVNEVVYDSIHPADLIEFIELVNTGTLPVDFGATPVKIVGVNGSNNVGYNPLSVDAGVLPVGGRMVIGTPTALALSTSADLLVDLESLTLQNGAPDGFVIINAENVPVAAYVWEGEILSFSFEGTVFDISDITTVITSQQQTSGSSCVLPDVTGVWSTCALATPGDENSAN